MKPLVALRNFANVFMNEVVYVPVCSYVAVIRSQLIPHGEHSLYHNFGHPVSINYYRLLSTCV